MGQIVSGMNDNVFNWPWNSPLALNRSRKLEASIRHATCSSGQFRGGYCAKNLRPAPDVVWTNAVRYFSELLDPRIAIAEAPVAGKSPDLLPDEAAAVAHAVPSRQLEFAKGRDCARKAMAALGYVNASLPRGQNRAPLWPDGLVGSITHTDRWTAAAVARRDQGFLSIGIDLESVNDIASDLWNWISTPEERVKIADACGLASGVAAHFIFCMKEAAFKCQYPISGAMLEFVDFAVDVDAQCGTFAATFQRAAPGFEVHDKLSGRFAISGGYIASAVVITTERVS